MFLMFFKHGPFIYFTKIPYVGRIIQAPLFLHSPNPITALTDLSKAFMEQSVLCFCFWSSVLLRFCSSIEFERLRAYGKCDSQALADIASSSICVKQEAVMHAFLMCRNMSCRQQMQRMFVSLCERVSQEPVANEHGYFSWITIMNR